MLKRRTINEPHHKLMNNLMALCPGWTYSSIIKQAGINEEHVSWMYEFRSNCDEYYLQIKKELDTGLFDVIFAKEKNQTEFPFFSVFYDDKEAITYVANIILYLNNKNVIKLTHSAKCAIQSMMKL